MTETKQKQPANIYVVTEGEGTRLDRWLKRQVPDLKQSILEKMLRLGKIRLNDKKTKASVHVAIDDVITVVEDLATTLEKYKDPLPRPEPKPLPPLSDEEMDWFQSIIIWEDESFLVINKPSGLAVQGGTKTTSHIDRFLAQYGKMKNGQYRLVHRIDRDTSGVLLIAKTAAMATYLTECFREGRIDKTYWAIVVDHLTPGYGTIKAPMIKAGFGDREKVVVDEKNGKRAVTHYRTIKRLMGARLPSLSWLELKPETGRTHQLRVHCEHMDTPIIGDGKYGGFMATSISKTLHLHARSLSVRDKDGARFTFVAPPPPHFEETFKKYKVQWNSSI